jgi:hypothetical protein
MNIARVAALCAIALLVPATAQAGPRDDLVAGMAKCAAIADNAARLACFDALTPTVKAAQFEGAPPPVAATAPGAPGAAPSAAAPGAQPPVADNRPWYSVDRILGVTPREQTRPEQFGGENLAPPPPAPGSPEAANQPPPPLDSITSGVTEYSLNPYKKFIVILDNGQIWQQLPSDDGIAHFMKGAKNTVVISRGMLESYSLVLNDGATFKVRRLK